MSGAVGSVLFVCAIMSLAALVSALALAWLGLRLRTRGHAAAQAAPRLFPSLCVLGALAPWMTVAALYAVLPRAMDVFNDFDVELPSLTLWILDFGMWLTGRASPDQTIPGALMLVPLLALISAGCVVAAIVVRRDGGQADETRNLA